MKLRTRVWGLCLGSSILLIALTLAGILQMDHLTQTIATGARQQEEKHFQAIMATERQAIDAYVYDLTWWDDMVEFVQTADLHFGDENIKESLSTYGLNAGWVFSPDFTLVYSAINEEIERPSLISQHIKNAQDTFITNHTAHFYVQNDGEIIEVFGSSIHAGDDEVRALAPQGYFIVARKWGSELSDKLARLSDCQISTEYPFQKPPSSGFAEKNCQFSITLENQTGQTAGILHVSSNLRYLQSLQVLTRKYMIFFIGVYLFLAASLIGGLYCWILFPLKKISQSLRENSTAPLRKLTRYMEIREMEKNISQRLCQKDELKTALDEAKSANHAKTQFLRNLSHELKTPLNGILGAEQLLNYTSLDEEQHEYLEIIRGCGDGLHTLIEQLLTLSYIECGTLNLQEKPFAPEELLVETCEFARQKSEGTTVAFHSNFADCKLPPILIGDAPRISQILLQIISNAFKFTCTGEIKLHISTRAELQNQITIRFVITDTGIGICPQQVDELMEIFTQADNSDSRRYAGLGIGLALVRALVSKMNGVIAIASEKDAGTRVTIDIPLRKIS